MAREAQRDEAERMLNLVVALAEIRQFVNEIEEGEQPEEGGQHQYRGGENLSRQITLEDPQSAAQRHRQPQGTMLIRRQKSATMPTNMSTWTAQMPTSNESRPCATQAWLTLTRLL